MRVFSVKDVHVAEHEKAIHHYVISALLGHSTPSTGFGHASRVTPGYGHVTWDTMVAAVESLERPVQKRQQKFRIEVGQKSGKSGGREESWVSVKGG